MSSCREQLASRAIHAYKTPFITLRPKHSRSPGKISSSDVDLGAKMSDKHTFGSKLAQNWLVTNSVAHAAVLALCGSYTDHLRRTS